MSLDAYRDRVEMLARERQGEPIYSGSLDQASIVVANLIASAKSSICILSDNLNARVYGREEVLHQAQLFLADRKHRLMILLEIDNPDDLWGHPLFERFEDYDNVLIRQVPPKIRETYKFHFLVTDDDSYRFQQDKNSHPAVAAFGDKKGASHIRKIFHVLWDGGKQITIPHLHRESA